MTLFPRVGPVLALAASAVAQVCNTVDPPPGAVATQEPFQARFYRPSPNPLPAGFQGFALAIDLDVNAPLELNQMWTWLYDLGQGNPPTPDQTGLTAAVRIYLCAGSIYDVDATTGLTKLLTPPDDGRHLGGPVQPPVGPLNPWVNVANGTCVVAGGIVDMPVAFPAFWLTRGWQGMVIEFVPPDPTAPMNLAQPNVANAGPLHPLIGAPGAPLPVTNAFVAIHNQTVVNNSFQGGVMRAPLTLRLGYQPRAGSAYWQRFGSGCPVAPAAFFDQLDAGFGAIDGTHQNWSVADARYLVDGQIVGSRVMNGPRAVTLTAGPPAVNPPGTQPPFSWDDALSAPITLAAAIPVPGVGLVSQITVGSNGFVFLGAVADPELTTAWRGNLVDLQFGPPRFCPLWCDLDPSAGGAIVVDDQLAGGPTHPGAVSVTWIDVPCRGGTAGNTFQLLLRSSGNVEVLFESLATNVAGPSALLGFAPGNGAQLPAELDLAPLSPTSSLPYQAGSGRGAPFLTMSARPMLGTTTDIVTHDIALGTAAALLAIDLTRQPLPGLDLGMIGAPGCRLLVGGAAMLQVLSVNGREASGSLSLPANAALAGLPLHAQTLPLTSGVNAVGVTVSDALCMRLGFDDTAPPTVQDLLLFDPGRDLAELVAPPPGQPLLVEVIDFGPFSTPHQVAWSTDDPRVTVAGPATLQFGQPAINTVTVNVPNVPETIRIALQAAVNGPELRAYVAKVLEIKPRRSPTCNVTRERAGRVTATSDNEITLVNSSGSHYQSTVGPHQDRLRVITSILMRNVSPLVTDYYCTGSAACENSQVCAGQITATNGGYKLECACR